MSLRKNRRRNETADRTARERQIFHNAPADEMFLYDALHRLRSDVMIPDAFGIDEGDGSALADAEAIGARTVDLVQQAEFAQTPLEIVPSLDAFFAGAAFGLGLIGAQKNVAADGGQLQIRDTFRQAVWKHLG